MGAESMASGNQWLQQVIQARLSRLDQGGLPDSGERVELGVDSGACLVMQVVDGRIVVEPGVAQDAIVRMRLSDGIIPELQAPDVADGLLGRLTDVGSLIGQGDVIRQDVHGTLRLRFMRESGGEERLDIGFTGLDQQQPSVVVTLPGRLMKVAAGTANARKRMMQAMISGDIRIEGDMGFLQRVSNVMDMGLPALG